MSIQIISCSAWIKREKVHGPRAATNIEKSWALGG